MADLTAGTTRYSGTRVNRVEDARLVTGHGTFVDDVTRPGMLHAGFVRSPFARALGWAHRRHRGPGGARRARGADRRRPQRRGAGPWYSVGSPRSPRTPLPPLADDEVRFVGDPVAVVVASDRYTAEDAAELVVVDFDPLEPVPDYATALRRPSSSCSTTSPTTWWARSTAAPRRP